eukprot:31387-Pelagococcus_subviridis.AAC.26
MSPNAWRKCDGTALGAGPFSAIVWTMSGSNIWMFGGMSRAYSWNRSMMMSGHSVMTLNDRVESVCTPVGTASAANGFTPAVSSPNVVVTVSFTPLYTSHTNCRNGSTSDSRLGRKFR